MAAAVAALKVELFEGQARAQSEARRGAEVVLEQAAAIVSATVLARVAAFQTLAWAAPAISAGALGRKSFRSALAVSPGAVALESQAPHP